VLRKGSRIRFKPINKTINFLKGIIQKTYRITKVISKSGVVQKVTIGFVTFVFALGLRFGSLKPVEPIIQSQTQIERQLQHSSSTQPYQAMEGSNSPSVSNLLKLSGGGELGKGRSPGARARSGARKATKSGGSSNNRIEIQAGDQIYMFKNPYRQNADELQFKLAEKIYDSIRECDTDICDIAENLGFKADNIKNVKDHVFYNEHDLDRYGPDEIEHKRFDATLEQALAWKRLETGTYTQDDVTWIKHECAERHHESKYNSGYTEAHERAQSRYEGYPWENKF
jgi:hypothetical protein